MSACPVPCPRPREQVRALCQSVRGQTILDPFMGSGTTAVATMQAGKRCVGIEKDEVVTKREGEVGGQSPDWFVVARLRSLRPGYWEKSVGGGAKGSAGNNPANAVDDRCFDVRDPVNHSITA